MKNIKQIPKNAKNIIIVLGQCLLKSGEPHQWMRERIQYAYQIYRNSPEDTYLILSGSDVSNRQYGITKNLHPSQSQIMTNLLIKLHKQHKEQKINIQQHIIKQQQANTTVQNFYYSFKILSNCSLNQVESIIILTSDFHIQRSKLCFDTMFFNENKTIIQYSYQKIKFIGCRSQWTSEHFKEQKFKAQKRIMKDQWFLNQLKYRSEGLKIELLNKNTQEN